MTAFYSFTHTHTHARCFTASQYTCSLVLAFYCWSHILVWL